MPKVLDEWFVRAVEHGKLHDSWTVVIEGSEAHKAWTAYFGRHQPVTLREIHFNKDRSWTAPCEWPDDLGFSLAECVRPPCRLTSWMDKAIEETLERRWRDRPKDGTVAFRTLHIADVLRRRGFTDMAKKFE